MPLISQLFGSKLAFGLLPLGIALALIGCAPNSTRNASNNAGDLASTLGQPGLTRAQILERAGDKDMGLYVMLSPEAAKSSLHCDRQLVEQLIAQGASVSAYRQTFYAPQMPKGGKDYEHSPLNIPIGTVEMAVASCPKDKLLSLLDVNVGHRDHHPGSKSGEVTLAETYEWQAVVNSTKRLWHEIPNDSPEHYVVPLEVLQAGYEAGAYALFPREHWQACAQMQHGEGTGDIPADKAGYCDRDLLMTSFERYVAADLGDDHVDDKAETVAKLFEVAFVRYELPFFAQLYWAYEPIQDPMSEVAMRTLVAASHEPLRVKVYVAGEQAKATAREGAKGIATFLVGRGVIAPDALEPATQAGWSNVVTKHLEAGVAPKAHHVTTAQRGGYGDLVMQLLEAGAPVPRTAVWTAVHQRDFMMLHALRTAGASVNATVTLEGVRFGDRYVAIDSSPLIAAVLLGWSEGAEWLISNGADVAYRDGLGLSALDVANIELDRASNKSDDNAQRTAIELIGVLRTNGAEAQPLAEAKMALNREIEHVKEIERERKRIKEERKRIEKERQRIAQEERERREAEERAEKRAEKERKLALQRQRDFERRQRKSDAEQQAWKDVMGKLDGMNADLRAQRRQQEADFQLQLDNINKSRPSPRSGSSSARADDDRARKRLAELERKAADLRARAKRQRARTRPRPRPSPRPRPKPTPSPASSGSAVCSEIQGDLSGITSFPKPASVPKQTKKVRAKFRPWGGSDTKDKACVQPKVTAWRKAVNKCRKQGGSSTGDSGRVVSCEDCSKSKLGWTCELTVEIDCAVSADAQAAERAKRDAAKKLLAHVVPKLESVMGTLLRHGYKASGSRLPGPMRIPASITQIGLAVDHAKKKADQVKAKLQTLTGPALDQAIGDIERLASSVSSKASRCR